MGFLQFENNQLWLVNSLLLTSYYIRLQLLYTTLYTETSEKDKRENRRMETSSMESQSKKRRTETEEDDSTFSHDLVLPLYRKVYLEEVAIHRDVCTWGVIEKGSKKSDPTERYKISYDIIALAELEVKRCITTTVSHADDQLYSKHLNGTGFKILLKEPSLSLDYMNNVKARGAVYSLLMLSPQQKRKGVITISNSSFALSLCHFGKKLEIPVTVVMPISGTDKLTFYMCQSYEATVHVEDNIVEAHKEALRIAKEKGLVYIDGSDHPNVIIGQATWGIEVMKDLVNMGEFVDQVILPTTNDNCGLTAGLAMAIKGYNPDIKVTEVQYESDFSIKPVREKSIFSHELHSQYDWYTTGDRESIVHSLFDSIVKVGRTHFEEAVKCLRQKETEDCPFSSIHVADFNVAIGVAAILSNQIYNQSADKNRVLILGYDKVDLPIKYSYPASFLQTDEPSAGPSDA